MRKHLQKKSLSKIGSFSCGRMLLLFAFLFNVSFASAQNISVRGIVKDTNDDPIAGATVIIKETGVGFVTDQQGVFTITTPARGTITVNSLGYVSQDVPVNERTYLEITMEQDLQVLEDLVVVGYGTMRKSDVTGSISTAKGADIVQSQPFSAMDGLRGKVSGVNVFSNSGQPGSYSRVIIRGVGTINTDYDPLYVVDGTVMSDGFSLLNPNDIENMEVLKDASATAIYGARGANGVILVTTKRGKQDGDGLSVTYNGSVSISKMARKIDVLSASQWQDAFMLGLEHANTYKDKRHYSTNMADHFTDSRYFDSNGRAIYDTDWQDEATRVAVSHNHQLSIQQASRNSSFGAFLNYTDQQGILLESYMRRINGRMTFDAKPKKWLSTSMNLSVNHSWGNDAGNDGMGDGGQNALRTMIEMPAWYPVKNPDGSWADDNTAIFPEVVQTIGGNPDGSDKMVTFSAEDGANPVHFLKNVKRRQNRTQIFGSASFTFHLTPHLDLQARAGLNHRNSTNRQWNPTDVHDFGKGQHGRASNSNTNWTYWQQETFLTYSNTWAGKHRFSAVAGMAWEETMSQNFSATGDRFPDDYFQWWNMGVGVDRPSVSSGRSRSAMNSYFVRAAYTYDNRYSATFTARADGSSKFGENNKFAFFPSAGLAWTISNEKFMQNARNIDLLKLHTSYGLTGNSGISNYESMAKMSTSTSILGNSTVNTMYLANMANKNLKWEKTAQFDVGVELAMFRDRLSVDASFYHKYTTDLLYSRPLPYSTGFSSVMDNIGEVSNMGLDLMLRGYPIRNDNFQWMSSINLNYNKNKVEKLGENDETVWAEWGTLKVGESLGSFAPPEWLGIETDVTSSSLGRSILAAERKVMGKGMPDWTGSFINTFYYKGFDLTIDFQYSWGADVYMNFLHSTEARFLTSGLSTIWTDSWRPGMDRYSTKTQMVYNRQYGDNHVDQNGNSSWIADGSFLRLNLVQLGYTFNSRILAKSGIKALRVYFNANNLWLLCSDEYKGFDPENSSKNTSRWGQGVEFFSYPKARMFSLGVNITF